MPQPFSLLHPDREQPSVILLCDRQIESSGRSFFSEPTSEALANVPMQVFHREKWRKLRWPQQNGFLDVKEEEAFRSMIGVARNALASVLIRSPGGLSFVGGIMQKALVLGCRSFGWSTQAVVQQQAASAAGELAMSAQKLFAADDADFMFHIGFVHNGNDCPQGSADVYAALNRMKKLAQDPVAFRRAGIEQCFRDILERPTVSTDDHICLTGKQLRDGTVIQQEVTQEHIATAIDEVLRTDPPAQLKKRLVALQQVLPANEL